MRAPDKWFFLLEKACRDVSKVAAGELSVGAARRIAAVRTAERLAVEPSHIVGGGLGVFATVDIPEVSGVRRRLQYSSGVC